VVDGNARTGDLNTPGANRSGATQGMAERNGAGISGQAPGTNAAGTAAPSGSSRASTQGTAPAGGIGRPAPTNEHDSDAKIDQENSKVDRTVGKICKNC
jgi:hypothetical protein